MFYVVLFLGAMVLGGIVGLCPISSAAKLILCIVFGFGFSIIWRRVYDKYVEKVQGKQELEREEN